MKGVNIGLVTLGSVIAGTAGLLAATFYLLDSEPTELSNYSMPSLQLSDSFVEMAVHEPSGEQASQPFPGEGEGDGIPPWQPAATGLSWQEIGSDDWSGFRGPPRATALPTLPLMVGWQAPSSGVGGALYESRGGGRSGGAPSGGGPGGGARFGGGGGSGGGTGGGLPEPAGDELEALLDPPEDDLPPVQDLVGTPQDDEDDGEDESENGDNGDGSSTAGNDDPPADDEPIRWVFKFPQVDIPLRNTSSPNSGPNANAGATGIPEPAGWTMLMSGLAALAWHRRRRRRGQQTHLDA